MAPASGPTNGRSMPAWADLAGGANGTNGHPLTPTNGAPPTAAPIDPLPHRRAGNNGAVEGELMPDGPAIPRQVPASPEAGPSRGLWGTDPATQQPTAWPSDPYTTPVSAPPTGSMPVSAVPVSGMPVSAMPVSGGPATMTPPSQSAPPVWPPVSAPAPAEPVVYQRTNEYPTVTSAPPAQPTLSYVPPAPAMAAGTVPYADETMELPIFRELESAWFRTRKPAAGETAEAPDVSETAQIPRIQADEDLAGQYRDAATGQYRTTAPAEATGQYPTVGSTNTWDTEDQRSSTTASSSDMGGTQAATEWANGGSVTVPAGYSTPSAYTPSWQTAADDGWAAATAAASDPEEIETTGSGLPKRTPMAQLVPGGIDKAASTPQRRTPEGVRGLLSAYHRGVQRGRTQQKDEDSTAGSNPNGRQAGKEHEA